MILGIVGSPRKNGITNMLVDAALKGVESKSVETKKIYLVDYDISPFKGIGGAGEAHRNYPKELSSLCDEIDGMILGAPVYMGDINGLTKDFMDTARIPNTSGKPAIGIAIAGGTGKGLLSGVQSIYHFFFQKQFRSLNPTPVSRFNLQETLEELVVSGAKLADLSREKFSFYGKTSDDKWPEVLAHYASLNYLRCDTLDEFVMLAEQLVKISKGNNVEEAKAELDKARNLIADGKRIEASRHAVRSYQILYFPS
jgi:multimeric flavodoxin WrbA